MASRWRRCRRSSVSGPFLACTPDPWHADPRDSGPQAGRDKPPVPSNCLRPVLSTDGDLFRLVQACSNNGAKGVNLFYTPEFLDVVGPTTHISGISASGPGAIRLSWSAQDPTPGAGVAYAQGQGRVDGGAWQSVSAATQSDFVMYKQAQAGHTYTFRVRSRDKVNNWGPWVTATLKMT